MTDVRFPLFDHPRKPDVVVVDGVPTICNDRDVIAELDIIEPLDERTDEFLSMPIRSVHTAGAGFSIELGPCGSTCSHSPITSSSTGGRRE